MTHQIEVAEGEKKEIFEVKVNFYGIIGKQRKIQHQALTGDELAEQPDRTASSRIAHGLLSENNARKISASEVRVRVTVSELENRNGVVSKSTMVFSNERDVFEMPVSQ